VNLSLPSLCPHFALSLPSLWYEQIQIEFPGFVYGMTTQTLEVFLPLGKLCKDFRRLDLLAGMSRFGEKKVFG